MGFVGHDPRLLPGWEPFSPSDTGSDVVFSCSCCHLPYFKVSQGGHQPLKYTLTPNSCLSPLPDPIGNAPKYMAGWGRRV